MNPPRPRVGYLFERFPSYMQMFCLREVTEMERAGMAPFVTSMREAEELPDHTLPTPGGRPVIRPPAQDELRLWVRDAAARKQIPKTLLPTLQQWGERPDKLRLYEAAWLGPRLRAAGVRHVHAHFAGIAARTAYWLRRFFGMTYSFTGHANDIFRETDSPVTLSDLMENAAFVATVSQFSATELAARFPKVAGRVAVVYNGLEVGQFTPVKPAENPPTIVSVGRLVEKKGYPWLLESCRILEDQAIPFQCRIIGDGPMRGVLEEGIVRLKLQDRVLLAGAQSEQQIRKELAAARVFALHCVREEGGGMDNLPTVITEAMATGLPVVSTKLAGVPEQVIHDQTGLLVEEKDIDGFADALKRILSDPPLATSLGKQGRCRAEEVFSLKATTAELLRAMARRGKAQIPPALLFASPRLILPWMLRHFTR